MAATDPLIQTLSSADSVDTSFRYSAYAARIRTLMISAHRYVAYTSEVGESFRPVAHPWLVRGAYGISWAYIFGDVANEGYKAYLRNRQVLAPQCEAYKNATSFVPVEATLDQVSPKGLEEHEPHERHLQDQSFNSTSSSRHPIPWRDPEEDTLTPWSTMKVPLHEDYRAVMAERAVFQVLASMALPAFTIHSVVKHSGRAMKGFKSTLLRTWGPVGVCDKIFVYHSMPICGYLYANQKFHSSVYVSYPFYHTCLTSPLNMLFNGHSAGHS